MNNIKDSENDWSQVKAFKKKKNNKTNFNKRNSNKRNSNKRKKFSKKKKIVNSFFKKDHIHFIPRNLKFFIDNLFKKGLTSNSFFEYIDTEVAVNSNVRNSVIVYILNEAATFDKLDYIEYILNNIKNRKQIVNTKCGFMGYTPIFNSAYRGSIKALKMLCCGGADLSSKNKEGESVLEALEQGRKDTIKKDRSYEIFINARYEECRLFLTNFNFKEKVINFKKKSKTIKENVFENDINLKEISLNDFIDIYYDNIDKVIEYMNINNDKVLPQMICNILERDNIYCDKFISNLPIIGLCGYKEIVLSSLSNEDVQDFINLDAPYIKNKVDEIIYEMS